MPISDDYQRIPLSSISISRPDRQRKEVTTDDLEPSIRTHGVLNPIIVSRDMVLIAGERRYTASLKLGLQDIPVRFLDQLSFQEARVVELEENVKRKNLSWQEQVDAMSTIHKYYMENHSDWTVKKTAESIGMDESVLYTVIRVSKEIDPMTKQVPAKLAGATSIRSAFNVLSRQDERKKNDIIADILSTPNLISSEEIPRETQPESILMEDFISWAPTYTGQPFNFIHCDFPYGINFFEGEQSGKNNTQTYKDDPDVYWKLISCLCKHRDTLLAQNSHMLFWFSMEYYQKTLEAFASLAPDLDFQTFPLIWHKTDNTGILPDHKRQPRRIYETAFLVSRGDRYLVKCKANTYGAPTERSLHPSTKPEPMLRFFMEMLVDENTRMLDPTCGGGSSLRAAESLGAKEVLGLEREPEFFENAKSALKKFRALRKI